MLSSDEEDEAGPPPSRKLKSEFLEAEDLVGKEGIKLVRDALQLTSQEVTDTIWFSVLILTLLFTVLLGRFFAPATAFFSGPQLYSPAWFKYDAQTKFDDTVFTWGTDYALAMLMGYIAWRINGVKETRMSSRIKETSGALLASYSLSTFAGAVAHQFLSGKLNTSLFRFVWKICVGSVAAAGGLMGASAASLLDLPLDDKQRYPMPHFPGYFWSIWSIFFFALNGLGFFSMKVPACDIFLLGVTQAPPTFYLCLVAASRRSWKNVGVENDTIAFLFAGALANIILLPFYDFAQATKLPLWLINTLMHSLLGVSWGLQGLVFLRFAQGASSFDC